MIRKIGLASLWLGFVSYAIASSFYKSQEGDFDLIVDLSTGQWQEINPIIIAMFYIMGIFPVVYAAFILFDYPLGTLRDRNQNISPYPFCAVSFGVGAFALLPYLALRQPDTSWDGQKNWILKILDSRLMAIISSISLVTLLIWGLTGGNWSDFVSQWQTSQFIHVMTLDFCLLCILFPTILGDDIERRGVEGWLKSVALFPLFGALLYWCFRPQLPETVASQSTAS